MLEWLVKIFFWRRLRDERRFWAEADVQVKMAQSRARAAMLNWSELQERIWYLQDCIERGENIESNERLLVACEDALSALDWAALERYQ